MRRGDAMRFITYMVASAAISMLAACGAVAIAGEADLVLKNGIVWTVDDELPRAEAIAVTGASIVYVGDGDGVGGMSAQRRR
jgi:hypothetical protein